MHNFSLQWNSVVDRSVVSRKDHEMLVLSRRIRERIDFGDNIEISLVQVRSNRVRLGVNAPAEVPILRSELAMRTRSNDVDGRT